MKMLLSLLMCLWLSVLAPANAQGQTALQGDLQGPPKPAALSDSVFGPGLDFAVGEAGMSMNSDEPQGSSTAIEIALILTLLSVLPALLITVTCFTRIVIVLSFVRRAMSINELPPNPVLIGLALFLTSFVMGPILTNIYNAAWVPYQAEELTASQASDVAWDELSGFLLANTRQSEIELFEQIASGSVFAAETAESSEKTASGATAADALQDGAEAPPMRVVVPAFILSELKTAFQMGFLLFLPFLVIDIVVSSVLLSMGMFMLPPAMISTPFKILLFVMVDGWHLVISSLVTSFVA